MKYAISTDGDRVSAHFGRCPEFTIVEIDNAEVTSREIIPNPGHHPGFLPQFLNERGVGCIVAGGMGPRAHGLFSDAGIRVIVGVQGRIDDTVEELKKGTLTGGQSLCKPGAGRGYGVGKTVCTHGDHHHEQPLDPK